MSKPKAVDQANPLDQLSTMIEQFKVPGVDMSAIIESRRMDMEALVDTNKALLGSMNALTKKQAEIFEQAIKSVQANAQALTKSGAPTPDPAKYAELARGVYEKAVGDMTALADIARKAQADLMAGIAARAHQSLEEFKALKKPK